MCRQACMHVRLPTCCGRGTARTPSQLIPSRHMVMAAGMRARPANDTTTGSVLCLTVVAVGPLQWLTGTRQG